MKFKPFINLNVLCKHGKFPLSVMLENSMWTDKGKRADGMRSYSARESRKAGSLISPGPDPRSGPNMARIWGPEGPLSLLQ